MNLVGSKLVKLISVELEVSDLAQIMEACRNEAAALVPTVDLIPSYRRCTDLFSQGEAFTCFFAALGVSEVIFTWQKSIDTPLNFVLPPNVESLCIEVLMTPFTDFEALS